MALKDFEKKAKTQNRATSLKREKHEEEAAESLFMAILQLKNPKECASFFQDLCTPSELSAMSERLKVAKLLDEKTLSYREIHDKTGVSLATIGRVARFLTQERNLGYRLILDRLNRLKGKSYAI